jgi:hypothetical protein
LIYYADPLVQPLIEGMVGRAVVVELGRDVVAGALGLEREFALM